jgi:hypothetical protein
MTKLRMAMAVGLCLSTVGGEAALAQAGWKLSRTVPLGGEGSWDYLTVDPATHRLFIPRSTHTMVVDAASGKVLGDIAGQKIAHGVAVVPELSRGFISDGGGGIVVFDLKTYKTLGIIPSERDSDGIIYDAGMKRILVVSGDGGDLMVFSPDIDPVHGKIDVTIPLNGAPEFLATDSSGKVFINLEDKDVVAVVEMATKKVIARWPVAPGGAPVGMAIDEKAHRLIIGGRKPQRLIVMSTQNGKVISTLPIGDHVDATKIEGNELFASCADGTLSVVKETAPGKFAIVQTVQTEVGARTMGIDPTTHTIYLPTADYEVSDTTTVRQPHIKPGTFKILVVTRER